MKKTIQIFTITMIAFLSNVVNAQLYERYVPEGVTEDELLALKVLGYAHKGFSEWNEDTLEYEIFKEQFNRAALLRKCEPIYKAKFDNWLFNDEFIQPVKNALKKIKKNELFEIDLQTFKYMYSDVLWAFNQLNYDEKRELKVLYESVEGKELLEHFYTLLVIEGSVSASDANTGEDIILYPLYINKYFTAVNKNDILKNLISEINSNFYSTYASITFTNALIYNNRDLLKNLTENFRMSSNKLAELYINSLEIKTHLALIKLRDHNFLKNYMSTFFISEFFYIHYIKTGLEYNLNSKTNELYPPTKTILKMHNTINPKYFFNEVDFKICNK